MTRSLQRRDHLARRAAARCRRRAARRADAARQGPDRHRGHPHDVRLADLRRPRPGRPRDASCSGRSTPARSWSGRATCPSSRGACSASNPWYGTVHNPLHPGKTTGGSSAGNAAALAAGLVDLGIGTDTGCSIRLPSAACGTVGLKSRWGLLPLDGVFPLCPSLDTVGPMGRTVEDVALLWSVLSGRRGAGAPARRPHGRPAATGARSRRRARRRRRATRPRRGSPISSGSAPGSSSAAIPAPGGHVAALPARGGAEPPRDVPRPRRRVRVHDPAEARGGPARRRQRTSPRPTAPSKRGGPTSPRSTSTSAPASPSTCRPRTPTSSRCRLPLSSFLRWVNLIGWAGLAVGNMQFVAPDDETVLAAGLAWERR